jgi:hypothetical protein
VGLLLQYLLSAAQAPVAAKIDSQPTATDISKPKAADKPMAKVKTKPKTRAAGKS